VDRHRFFSTCSKVSFLALRGIFPAPRRKSGNFAEIDGRRITDPNRLTNSHDLDFAQAQLVINYRFTSNTLAWSVI
jgi:hypothetical protein